jgi:divalent metal cation (Fe/Co/Zn/Cd) transporter
VRSLRGREEPQASPVGIAVTALSIAVMLWLTRAKRRTGEALGSSALVADA